jgi:hypothetical protein
MRFNDIELFALRYFNVSESMIKRFNNVLAEEKDEDKAFEIKKQLMNFCLKLNSNNI